MPENVGRFEIENSHLRLQPPVAANVAASNRIVNRTVVHAIVGWITQGFSGLNGAKEKRRPPTAGALGPDPRGPGHIPHDRLFFLARPRGHRQGLVFKAARRGGASGRQSFRPVEAFRPGGGGVGGGWPLCRPDRFGPRGTDFLLWTLPFVSRTRFTSNKRVLYTYKCSRLNVHKKPQNSDSLFQPTILIIYTLNDTRFPGKVQPQQE